MAPGPSIGAAGTGACARRVIIPVMPRQLIQLRPRGDEDYIGHSHSILICGRDGFIKPNAKQGLAVFQVRSLSELRHLLNGRAFQPVSLSAVQHHSWLGYYLARVPVGG
jgi:hypothetical protein